MQTTTRTARRPFRAAITAAGLVPTKRCEVLAHHGYYFGGSSSPSFVLVLAVTDDYVTYCDARRLESRREQRWIFEDLAARAGETVSGNADRAAAHGSYVNLESYDRVRVELQAGEGVDVYSYAGGLGVIVDYSETARTAAVECSQIDFNDYTRRLLATGERFDLTATVVATIKECPRA